MEQMHKRLLTATKYLIAIFSVCLIFLFHKYENRHSKEEFDTMKAMQDQLKLITARHQTANEQDGVIRSWMATHAEAISKPHELARLTLSRFLLHHGIATQDVALAKNAGSGSSRFSLLEFRPEGQAATGETAGNTGTFRELTDEYLEYYRPGTIAAITRIDTNQIDLTRLETVSGTPARENTMVSGGPFSPGNMPPPSPGFAASSYQFDLSIQHDSLRLDFFPRFAEVVQQSVQPITVLVPAGMSTVPQVSAALLMNDSQQGADTSLIDQLAEKYGTLPQETAQKKIADRYLNYFDNIQVLGFSIPSDLFYAIVFLFQLLIALSCIHSLLMGRKKGNEGLWDTVTDDLFEPLVNTTWARAIVWILLPIGNFMMALPINLNGISVAQVGMAFIVLMAYGMAFMYSLRPQRSTPVNPRP